MLSIFSTFIVDWTFSGEFDNIRRGCRFVDPLHVSLDSPKRSSPVTIPNDRCDISDVNGELCTSFGDESFLSVGQLVRLRCCICQLPTSVFQLYPVVERVLHYLLIATTHRRLYDKCSLIKTAVILTDGQLHSFGVTMPNLFENVFYEYIRRIDLPQ